MQNAKEAFETMLQDVALFLSDEGFKRIGSALRRKLPDGNVRWTIEFQKDRHNTDTECRFTLWVWPEWKRRPAYAEDWETKLTWYPGAGGRIGNLLPRQEDTWWEINAANPAPFIAAQIKSVLAAYALPFLRQFETEDDIRKYLRDATSGSMKRNYTHALQMLNFDILENKSPSEIEESINRARHLGKINGVHKDVIEAAIQRVLNKKMEER